MNIIVQKFGGSSVSTTKKISNICKHIIREYNQGNHVIVVVSAQGKTTNKLIEEEQEITLNASKREHDVLLSVGEQISIAKLTMMLHEKGYKAVSYLGWQIPIITNNDFGNARIEDIKTSKILKELKDNKIVIIAGFQGITKDKQITTLGRGGSDTTAVAIATAVHASKCDIYTDVDGIYSADPRIIKNITKINSITYDEMLELSSLGAKVLHNRCVEIGKEYNMPIYVKSSFKSNKGTKVVNNNNNNLVSNINLSSASKLLSLKNKKKNESKNNNKRSINTNINQRALEHISIAGITVQNDVDKIEYVVNSNDINVSYRLFEYITSGKIGLDMILQNQIDEKRSIISFTIDKNNLDNVIKILEEHKSDLSINDINKYIDIEEELSKISIVGNGIMSNTKVLETVYKILEIEKIRFHSIVTSEIKISILVKEREAEKLIKKLHEEFFENIE